MQVDDEKRNKLQRQMAKISVKATHYYIFYILLYDKVPTRASSVERCNLWQLTCTEAKDCLTIFKKGT